MVVLSANTQSFVKLIEYLNCDNLDSVSEALRQQSLINFY